MKHAVVIAAGLALVAAPAATFAQSAAKKARAADAKQSADRFSLDLAPADEDAAVTAPAPATPAEAPPVADAPATRLSLDTPIAEVLASRRGKAVLDRDMPGLSTDKNLEKFKALSLNRLAPLSGGRLSPALLEKVGKDLDALKQPGE